MDDLRIALLIAGIVVVAAIYVFARTSRRKAARRRGGSDRVAWESHDGIASDLDESARLDLRAPEDGAGAAADVGGLGGMYAPRRETSDAELSVDVNILAGLRARTRAPGTARSRSRLHRPFVTRTGDRLGGRRRGAVGGCAAAESIAVTCRPALNLTLVAKQSTSRRGVWMFRAEGFRPGLMQLTTWRSDTARPSSSARQHGRARVLDPDALPDMELRVSWVHEYSAESASAFKIRMPGGQPSPRATYRCDAVRRHRSTLTAQPRTLRETVAEILAGTALNCTGSFRVGSRLAGGELMPSGPAPRPAPRRVTMISSSEFAARLLLLRLDRPEIEDPEYDHLFRELVKLEERYPELSTPDSPTQRVAGGVADAFAEVEHVVPLLSLDSIHEEAELRDFCRRMERELGTTVIEYSLEPKYDGLSVELVYDDGVFSRGSTRGNGRIGEDITANLRTIGSLPLRLTGRNVPERLAVRGEAVYPIADFQRMNRELTAEGKEPFKNPRNAAAGALRQLDSRIARSRPLALFAYDILLHWNGDGKGAETQRRYLERRSRGSASGGRSSAESKQSRASRVGPRARLARKDHSPTIENLESATPSQSCRIIERRGVKVNRVAYQRELGERSRKPARWAGPQVVCSEEEDRAPWTIASGRFANGKVTPFVHLRPVLRRGDGEPRHPAQRGFPLQQDAGRGVEPVQRAGEVQSPR